MVRSLPQSREMSGRVRTNWLVCLMGVVSLAVVCPVAGQSSHELRALLNRLTGQWEGEVMIHTLDGREIGSFAMKRVYSWSGDVLQWQSVLELTSGLHQTRGRYFVRLGRLYATVSRPGMPAQDYTGTTQQGGVFWESALRDHRDVTESVVAEEEDQFLNLDSFEVLGLDEVPGVVRIKGRLRAVRDGGAENQAAREVGKGTEWLDPSDPIDLLRSYAPESGG
ncbi:MAG: hypothetical protein R3F07_20280 [Opitutaceae bacterium]